MVSYVTARRGELYVLEGRPDLKGVLWHVDAEGRRTRLLPEVGLFRRENDTGTPSIRFDVHPDGRRIVIEAIEFVEADISLIDGVR